MPKEGFQQCKVWIKTLAIVNAVYKFLISRYKLILVKMKKTIFFTVVLGFLTLISCDKQGPYYNYQGDWNGTYSGGKDSGTWSLTVSNEGKVSGVAISDSSLNATATMGGSVTEDGEFEATFGLFEGNVIFSGIMQYGQISGSWENELNDDFGSFEGSRAR